MDPDTAAKRADIHIVDVRDGAEWSAGHIEQAQHIPMDEIHERLDDLPKGAPLVLVCRSGTRSEQVVGLLVDEGFEADNLDGGMQAWMQTGLPVVDSDGRPGRVV